MTSARHRNKTCELRRKQGTTLIGTRRPHRGPHFTGGIAEKTLSDASLKLDEPSLPRLVRDFEMGQLEDIVRVGGT
jgi:hypothetical protein